MDAATAAALQQQQIAAAQAQAVAQAQAQAQAQAVAAAQQQQLAAQQQQAAQPSQVTPPAIFDKGPLLTKIKQMFRGSYAARAGWCSFCQVHGTTSKRPEDQDEAFLLTFTESFEQGGIPEFEGELPPEFQDPSDNWKGGGKGWGKSDGWGKSGGKGGWGKDDGWSKGGKGKGWGGDGGKGWDKGGKGGGKGASEGKVFVGGLPKSASESELHSYFGQWGAISQLQLKYDESGASRGFMFITFQDPSVARQLITDSQENGTTKFQDKWVDCKDPNDLGGGKGKGKGDSWDSWDNKRQRTDEWGSWNDGKGKGKGKSWDGGKGKGGKGKDSPPEKVFVGGLPKSTTDASVYQHFSQYGPIASVDLKYDQTDGSFRGFGFVIFQDKSAADMAAAASGCMFEGRQITIASAADGGKGKGGKGKW